MRLPFQTRNGAPSIKTKWNRGCLPNQGPLALFHSHACSKAVRESSSLTFLTFNPRPMSVLLELRTTVNTALLLIPHQVHRLCALCTLNPRTSQLPLLVMHPFNSDRVSLSVLEH